MSNVNPDNNVQNHIVLKGLSKEFNGTRVLEDMDLTIHDRELLVLLGPSGCGKSTTLNLLAGLEQPTSGELYFGDRLMNGVPAERREISMVFQSIGLYPHLNVMENITFSLRLQKVAPTIIQERVREVVEVLGIGRLTERRLLELSGGERQRVAIAKALVKRPYLFLLDEPFSSLDADLRRQLRADIVRIHRQLDTTMVFVTHDQEEAMSIADRIVVMSKARVQQVGSPLDVHDKPVNLWVSRFVGAHPINILDAYWNPEHQRLVLFRPEGPAVQISNSLWEALRDRGLPSAFTLGIRPQYLRLSPATNHSDASNTALLGKVYTRQVLGTQILYELQMGDHELRAVVPSDMRFEPEERVHIQGDWSQAFFFDKESEQCLYHGNH